MNPDFSVDYSQLKNALENQSFGVQIKGRFSTAASLTRSLRLRYIYVTEALAKEQASATRGQRTRHYRDGI